MIVIDIILTFFTPYYVGQKLIMNKCHIALNYFKFQFWIDTFTVIPFQLMSNSKPDGKSNSSIFSNFAEFSKLYRILRMGRILKATKIGEQGAAFINKFFRRIDKSNSLLLSIAPFYIIGIFIAYFFASLWFYFPDRFNFAQSWLERYSYKMEPVFDKLVGSLYFVYATVSTTGYGDIVPASSTEFLLAFIFMSAGVTFYSLVYSTIIAKMDQKRNQLDEIAMKKTLLRSLKEDDKMFSDEHIELFSEMTQHIDTYSLQIQNNEVMPKFKNIRPVDLD